MFQRYLSLKGLRRRHANPAQSPPQMQEDSINHPPPAPSSPDDPGVSVHSTLPEDHRLVITKMKAMKLFIGLGQIPPGLEQIPSSLQYISASLRQIPAGFYVNVLVENEEYQTANKPALVDGGMTEWENHIYMPSDLSSMVELRIYASPELGPMLGRGELLQKFSLSVGDLVQLSNTSRHRKVVSSWSSLQVTVKLLSPQDTNVIAFCSPVSAEPDEARAVAEATDIGHAHMLRYYKDADESHIREVVTHFRRVVDRCPSDNPARGAALSNLATAKFISGQATGAHLDMDMAIFLFQDAPDADEAQELLDSVLDICSAVSLEYRSAVLVAHTRFMHSGANDVVDPNTAAAFSSTQPAYLQSPPSFGGLYSKLEQCQQRDDPQLLGDVISQHHDALSFYVPGQPEWVNWKCNLAIALRLRFERQGRKQDLEEVILSYRRMLSWTPRARAKHCRALINLASELLTRFWRGGDRKDLEEAIQHYRDALVLTPPGHPLRASSVSNIATALWTQFKQGGDRKDLEEVIQHHRDALVLTPPGHPLRASLLNNIANVLLTRSLRGGNRKDLEEALHLCHIAKAESPLIHPCQHAESHHHSSALDAYARSLQLLDSHLSAMASISARHQARMHFSANLQLASGDPHAETLGFQSLSLILNQQPADWSSTQNSSRLMVEAEAAQYSRLVDEWNQVVSQIWTIEGFSHFLLPPSFSDLQETSSEGPIIVLIASNSMYSINYSVLTRLDNKCSSSAQHEIFHSRQEQVTVIVECQQLQMYAPTSAQSEVVQILEDLHVYSDRDISNDVVQVLHELWHTVVSPVVVELEKVVTKGSWIWWCPSSVFTQFPLHATGEYHQGGRNFDQLYVSSYTPSLSTLIKACQTRSSFSAPQFAAIVQAKPVGRQEALPYPSLEADLIEHLLHPPLTSVFTKLASTASTRDVALDALQNHEWIHFSCRGKQDFEEPFKSSLEMLDGPLSLIDIIRTDLSKHEFVYLSACQTAVRDTKTPDEMIHLAAGLQFGGVRSVIGTQWSVHDGAAFLLASEFYKEFCVDGVMNCTRAARALHQALQSLRKQKIPLREQIMFIHIGI
ncbi:hypothetical protein BDN67DRAFT_983674 [Paxillus ammoniavirescens]|nr:hypothetical protein BDN67DRAFT_983674 [Paxillus ammoniavirescens]